MIGDEIWRGKKISEMTQREFSDYIDAGRPRELEPPKAPAPVARAAPMDQAVQRGWDDWVKAHIRNELDEFGRLLMEGAGDAVGELNQRLRWEFKTEVAELRAEVARLREQQTGKVVVLPPGGRDAA